MPYTFFFKSKKSTMQINHVPIPYNFWASSSVKLISHLICLLPYKSMHFEINQKILFKDVFGKNINEKKNFYLDCRKLVITNGIHSLFAQPLTMKIHSYEYLSEIKNLKLGWTLKRSFAGVQWKFICRKKHLLTFSYDCCQRCVWEYVYIFDQ